MRPLTREEQKKALEEKMAQYKQTEPIPPPSPFQPLKESKPSENEQLQAFRNRLSEYGITPEIKKEVDSVTKQMEENDMKQTVKTFYCRHNFTTVMASWMGIPLKYKICSKCSFVK